MKFVIVEDEIRIREGIRKLLLKLDKEYLVAGEAENGMEALDIIRREEPDIVITDVKMPIMDGLEMLQQLDREGIKVKTIVLSAYSEFEYARKAMRMGVTEYLLKPIAINDFTTAIENMKQQIQRESREKPEQFGSLERILNGIISASVQPEEEVITFLKKYYLIGEDTPIVLLLQYLPQWEDEQIKKAIKNMKMIMAERTELSYCIGIDAEKKILWLTIYHYHDQKSLRNWIQSCLLRTSKLSSVKSSGWIESKSIINLKEEYDRIYSYLDWNIALGDNIIISYPEITKIQTAMCVYPIEMENQMKLAACNGSEQELRDCIGRFHEYFRGNKLYEPRKIKECYIRFFWAIMNYSKEVNHFDSKGMEQQVLLEKIMRARTMQELQCAAEEIVKRIRPEKDRSINNILVKRAVSMIHEFYQSGITLEEIAQKLEITPEYLGTQFHKELGVNFSSYIKDYRIGKAKELLLGTHMKIYEIAEKTGYTAPKYFSKVFRETTGQLPAEYRMTHK